jgi:hypothetical protein
VASPSRIFAEGGTSKQETLKMIWPELYEALAGIVAGQQSSRVLFCVLGDCGISKRGRIAVGRITRNGTPACAYCIGQMASRPGGWPLKLLGPDDE